MLRHELEVLLLLFLLLFLLFVCLFVVVVFSCKTWNKVLLMCVQKGRSQRASKFYTQAEKLSKQLSGEVRMYGTPID